MIYLVAAREVGLCKIGFAENVENRVAVLATACPHDLDLVATREGNVPLEKAIHRAAAEHHVRREWFRFCPELVETFHRTETPEVVRPHSFLIEEVGAGAVRDMFGLSPQTLHMWRVRGIPQIKRIAFAKMCAERGVAVPADFFEAFETRRSAA